MIVSATLKGHTDSNGCRTIYIRTSDGKKRKFLATKMRVQPKDWDAVKKRVKSSHPNATRFNAAIQLRITETMNGELNAPVPLFSEYAVSCLNEWDKSKQGSTLRQLTSKIDKFKSFKDVRLSEITSKVLTAYVDHCYKLGNKPNTVWSSLKVVRVIINKAYKERIIKENPFHFFKMPQYRDPVKNFLTKSQVDAIEKFARDTSKEYRIAAGWFLISCYTGLRFGDQIKFDKKQIKDGRLIMYTSKTGQPVSIKLNEKLKSLFDLVDYKPMPFTNEHYNRILKAVGAYCEIEERLTVHMARHTFGTLCASAGISQEVTAKLMGHSSIRTTSIYYKLTSDRIDSEVERIF